MFENVTTFISGITLLFGIFAIFLFIRLLSAWKNIDPDFIKARAFLAGKLIITNIVVIFVVGLLIVYHNFTEFLSLGLREFYYGYLAQRYPTRLIAVTELLIALLLVEWLMYQWLKITRR